MAQGVNSFHLLGGIDNWVGWASLNATKIDIIMEIMDIDIPNNELEYYTSQSPITSPGKYSKLLENIPDSLVEICDVVHGLVVHQDDTETLYNFELSNERKLESNTRYVEKIFARIIELDSDSLDKTRLPQKRYSGSCRDFAILTCSILRSKGVPSRLRCGFAAYFHPDWYSDHWICEYWDKGKGKWKFVDSELGKEESVKYKISFDKTDIPRDLFFVAGKAWFDCKTGRLDPNKLGVKEINVKGYWFIRADVLRDLASLNKVELLPWDYTSYFDKQFEKLEALPEWEVEEINQIAEITSRDNIDFQKVIETYKNNPNFQVIKELTSYTSTGAIKVGL